HTHDKRDAASRRAFLSSLVSAFVFLPFAYGQEKTPVGMAEQFRRMSEEYEKEGLAAPFRGITTTSGIVPDIFQIGPSGVSTGPVRNAARSSLRRWTTYSWRRRCSQSTMCNGENG
ncbi:MAG: hypothetical protein WBQ59_04015, partial [Candidatus Acidiferrum sp.]